MKMLSALDLLKVKAMVKPPQMKNLKTRKKS